MGTSCSNPRTTFIPRPPATGAWRKPSNPRCGACLAKRMLNTRSVVSLSAAVVAAVLLAQPFAPGALAAAQQKFKTGTLTVPLYATVTDADKRLVPDLEQTDFEVYDNGKLQPITLFENKNTPVAAIVMLDSS